MIEFETNEMEDEILKKIASEIELRSLLRSVDAKDLNVDDIASEIKKLVIEKTKEFVFEQIGEFWAVVGCGSMGSYLTDYLTRTRQEKILLIDFDKVEARNLAKQLFFKDDIGEYKAKALGERYELPYAIARAEEMFEVLTRAGRIYITSDRGSAYAIARELIERGVHEERIVILQSDYNVITVGEARGETYNEAVKAGSGWNNEGYDNRHTLADTIMAMAAAFANWKAGGKLQTIQKPIIVSKEKIQEAIETLRNL